MSRISSLYLFLLLRPRVFGCAFGMPGFLTRPTLALSRVMRVSYRSTSLSTTTVSFAKPKRGSRVDSYQTVSVNCVKCRERLFRYKKKNGTKSNLVKCYVERISEDSAHILERAAQETGAASSSSSDDDDDDNDAIFRLLPESYQWTCPSCNTRFARTALIHGRPALKMVAGKIRMTKK